MTAKVLIVDDEDLFRENFAGILHQRGYECRTASNGEEGLAIAEEFGPDLVFCDIVMPGKGGVEVLDEIAPICPESCVIMIAAYGSFETAVEALQKGAYDYIMKPLSMENVFQKIEHFMKYRFLLQEVRFLRRELSRGVESLQMVGKSDAMEEVFNLIRKVAPTRSTVLIDGESGTGKELVARAVHEMSDFCEHPFVAINCAGILEHLLESELFGHIQGAFTGAIKDRMGLFELAGEGTILLDEIAEMSLTLQSKLLRVLEEREFLPVGGTKTVMLKARAIASASKNLRDRVEAGQFREELFFRIAVFEIHLPPLRARRSDIPLLVEHFVREFNREMKRKCLGVDNEAMRRLLAHSWPGNVRELRNVIERAMILIQGDYITVADLSPAIMGSSQFPKYSNNLRNAMHAYEREHIRRVYLDSGGNKEETARRLGVNPSTLYRKMAELSIGNTDASRGRS